MYHVCLALCAICLMFVLITDLNRNICSAPRQPVTVTEHRLHHFLSSAEPDSYRCSAPQLQTIICRGIQVVASTEMIRTTGAHTHLYRQHSTQLRQLKKRWMQRQLVIRLSQPRPLAEMCSFRISIEFTVSSAAVKARSIQQGRGANLHSIVVSPCCSVALSVPRRCAVLVGPSLAPKRVSCSIAACQHQTCLFAWQVLLITSRTGLTVSRTGRQNRSGRVLLNSI